MKRLRYLSALALFSAWPGAALAIDSEEAANRARTALQFVESEMVSNAPPPPGRFAPPTSAERVAAGELLIRTRDYGRAIDTLEKVIELHAQGKVEEAAFADASFLLGEAYFQDRQYLAARRHFRAVLAAAEKPAYSGYAGRAISRLVDVALRTGDIGSLDFVFARLNQLPASDGSGSLQYARGKALFAKGDLNAAKAALGTVPSSSEFAAQSQYLLGVIMVRSVTQSVALSVEGANAVASEAVPDRRYAAAIEQFRKVTRLPARTPEERHVIDLSWMAIGRLFHETENYLDAAEAYSHIERGSPEFSTMLYELAWVYVRLGDYVRAERALEVLAIMDPDNVDAADGALLRADLMLRSGQFDKALALYRSVEGKFNPILAKVDGFLASTQDPGVYFDKLTADAAVESEEKLPAVVVEWAREQAENEHVFGMIEDVNRSRDLLKTSRKLAVRVNAVLAVPTRIKAFPDLAARAQQNLSWLNRTARARVLLADGLDDASSKASSELLALRRERQALARRLKHLPVEDGDFARRNDRGDAQWNKASQTLQGLVIESERLNAKVNGLRRVLSEPDQFGVTKDAASREQFRRALEQSEGDLAMYRQRIDAYRDAIEIGRAQIGFGDQRYVDDDDARRRFRTVFARELALVMAGQGGERAAEYAQAIQPLVARADVIEMKQEAALRSLDEQAKVQAAGLSRKVNAEVAALELHVRSLDGLGQESRQLIGDVAKTKFAMVRDRLKSIVLRADVGIVQEAWEVREEQRIRVRNLQRERAREEQTLNDELREVLDDAEMNQ